MQIEQTIWSRGGGAHKRPEMGAAAGLVLVFGGRHALKDGHALKSAHEAYPGARVVGCSTAGEIAGEKVLDDTVISTAIAFANTTVQGAMLSIGSGGDSFDVGRSLAKQIDHRGLKHVFVLSDGLKVNGSELVAGLVSALPEHITVTGGLSGDGERFEETYVLWESEPRRDAVAILGLYGDRLDVGYASLGGWDPFGPERLITRSAGNVLYELDGRSALDLYKQYLGDHAKGLPATGLLFPLCVRTSQTKEGVVRTILGVDEATQSMTFARDVPEGAYARLMKANFDRLIDGAVGAAKTSHRAVGELAPDLAILISCVGRKIVLRQRIEEEVEGVRQVFGANTTLAGFYSYGEISPFTPSAKCELHNQTMTITAFKER